MKEIWTAPRILIRKSEGQRREELMYKLRPLELVLDSSGSGYSPLTASCEQNPGMKLRAS